MKPKNIKGLTLLELIITIALIGIIGLVIISTFTNYSVSVFKSGHITEETLAAREIMDKLIASDNPSEDLTSSMGFSTEDSQSFKNEADDTAVEIKASSTTLSEGSSVPGKLVTVKVGSENPIALTAFIPD